MTNWVVGKIVKNVIKNYKKLKEILAHRTSGHEITRDSMSDLNQKRHQEELNPDTRRLGRP